MTCWLERAESRYLDLITISARALVELAKGGKLPDKYDIFNKSFNSRDLFPGIPSVIVDSQVKNFSALSQGRYIREMAYALVALDLAEDVFWKKIENIEANSFSDLTSHTLTNFVQSRESRYKPLQAAIDLSEQKFGSSNWAEILRKQILSYGYFIRFQDCIRILTNILGTEPVFITQIKNLIGPYDKIVKGGGPDFVQETFKSWGFFLGILDFRTGGALESYDEEARLQYLRKHTGFITDGKEAYKILRSIRKARIFLNYFESEPVRIICFMRLADLNIWRNDFDLAVCSALKRTRLIYLMRHGGEIRGSDLITDDKIREIERYYKCKSSIVEDLLFLESAGMRFSVIKNGMEFDSFTEFILKEALIKNPSIIEEMKTVTIKSIFFDYAMKIRSDIKVDDLVFSSRRKVDFATFEKYLFRGELFDWIRET